MTLLERRQRREGQRRRQSTEGKRGVGDWTRKRATGKAEDVNREGWGHYLHEIEDKKCDDESRRYSYGGKKREEMIGNELKRQMDEDVAGE